MGFNLYFAGSKCPGVEETLREKGINRLASQLNDRKLLEEWVDYIRAGNKRKLFVDSGAFSAHTKGKELDVDEYIQYLNDREGIFEVIAQVDKIPGEFGKPKTKQQLLDAPEESWQNYLYMRERVKDYEKLTPIFHQGEDFKHLHRMLETTINGEHIPYIGISPANDLMTPAKVKWFEHVFQIIRDSSNPNVKTHAFGMTSLKVLERYPFHSADSTSWIMFAANGSVLTSKGPVVMSDQQLKHPQHIMNLPPQARKEIIEEIESFGVTLEECMTDYKKRSYANAIYLKRWADNYQFKGTNRYQRRLF